MYALNKLLNTKTSSRENKFSTSFYQNESHDLVLSYRDQMFKNVLNICIPSPQDQFNITLGPVCEGAAGELIQLSYVRDETAGSRTSHLSHHTRPPPQGRHRQ